MGFGRTSAECDGTNGDHVRLWIPFDRVSRRLGRRVRASLLDGMSSPVDRAGASLAT